MASVATKNPFALLDDEPTSAPAAKSAAPAATTNTSSQRGNQRGARGRGGPASRGGKYYARGGPRTSGPREGGDEEPTGAGDSAEKRRPEGEGRGRGRGRGGRGGGRGGDRGGGDRGPRRTYDRHSATGKTDSDKKVHQGWGGDEGNTELRVEEAANTDAQVDASAAVVEDNAWGGDATAAAADAWGAPAPTGDAAAGDNAGGDRRNRVEREPEEPDNTLTLDQYLAQQKEKNTAVPQLETRKVQQDDKLWKDAIAVTRKDEEEDAYFVGKTKSAPKVRTKKEEKVFLEIDARFERPARGGRGRGERGERGGGGGRGPRGGDRRREGGGQRNINLEDESAFPSLS